MYRVQAAIGQYLLDWGVCSSELEASLVCEDLHASYSSPDAHVQRIAALLGKGRSLVEAAAESARAQPDSEALQPGLCCMCERDYLPLTEHHLWPREVQTKLIKRGLMAQADRGQKILICRQCHNAVHKTFDNKQLALDYHSLEALLGDAAIQKWVAYARKQKPRALQPGLKTAR